MSVNCNCPVCRYHRGRISARELAWVCATEIRVETQYLRMIAEAKSLEELKESVKLNMANVDEGMEMLEELKNKAGASDIAFDHPTEFNVQAELDGRPEETTVLLAKDKKPCNGNDVKNTQKAVFG